MNQYTRKAMLYDNSSSQWARTHSVHVILNFSEKLLVSYMSILRELDSLSVPFPHKYTLTHSTHTENTYTFRSLRGNSMSMGYKSMQSEESNNEELESESELMSNRG